MDETNQPQNQNPGGIAGKPLTPQVDANGNVYQSLEATNAPRPELPKIDGSEIIENLHKDEVLPHLRTYESDIAEAIKQDKASLVNIAMKQNAKEQEKQGLKSTVVIVADSQPEAQHKSSAPFILLTTVLIIGSLGVLGGIGYYLYTESQGTPITTPTPDQKTIPSETARDIVIKESDSLQDILAKEVAGVTATGEKIGRFSVKEEIANPDTSEDAPATIVRDILPETFGIRLDTQMPSWLTRSFTSYAVGYYRDSRTEPFLIFKTNSFENAFAGMIRWEPTMREDLLALWPAPVGTTTSTSTPAWKDKVIQNKDVRVLYSGIGEPLMYYSLTDKETIVITASEQAFRELLSRLTISQFSR